MEDYIVSARKYRPMTFDQVVGQPALTTTLKNVVKSGKLAHAYLFCGPRGVGKTTCARIFAKAINCENPQADGEACNECESCRAFNEGRSLNIFELDAASNNGVEQIKTLMEQTRIPPQIGRYKVFIIDEVHMLSTSAFNAFLKTLEEPPAHVVFILATTEKNKILPTILSRCQIYDFERMTVPEIVNHLKMVAQREHIQFEEPALDVIAEKADGGMRDALSIFDQVTSFSQGNITYEKTLEDLNVLDSDNYFTFVDMALNNKVSDMMVLLNTLIGKGFDAGNIIDGLASHLRNVLMAKDEATLPLMEVSQRQQDKFKEQAKKCPTPFIYKALKLLGQCDINYRQSSNKRLLVELTLIQVAQLTQPDDDAKPGAGRSPKRLKSLFKNLTTPQPKAVKQVTAAEKPLAAEPKASPKVAGVNMPSPETKPKASSLTALSGHPHLQIGGGGSTFGDLLHAHKPQEAAAPVINHDEEKPFTQEDLEREWMAMCLRMPQRLVGLAMRLKLITPHITTYPDVEVLADNQILLDQMEAIKGNLLATLTKYLHNGNIKLSLRLAKAGEVERRLTKREVFAELQKENPAFAHLTRELGLTLS